ncbi:hypothetical protein QQ045_002591 [Rhodiola kirilowii]
MASFILSSSSTSFSSISSAIRRSRTVKSVICKISPAQRAVAGFAAFGGLAVTVAGPALAAEISLLGTHFTEPDNALSLPTWAIHVSSVAEWIIAMGLVWQYGEKSGYESWKGLSWGMVPLLGGALCACTWHFFYNAESLEVLVALQAALTVLGNITMCIAAFRIYNLTQESSDSS